jgi:hypothetical protein
VQPSEGRVYRLDPLVLSVHDRCTPDGVVKDLHPFLNCMLEPVASPLIVQRVVMQLGSSIAAAALLAIT